MRLTDGNQNLRRKVMSALLDLSVIAGRTDRDAQLIFDDCTVDLDSGMIDFPPMDRMLGVYLLNSEEVDAMKALVASYDELTRVTDGGNELAWLSHPYYNEFAKAAEAAYDVMLASEADR